MPTDPNPGSGPGQALLALAQALPALRVECAARCSGEEPACACQGRGWTPNDSLEAALVALEGAGFRWELRSPDGDARYGARLTRAAIRPSRSWMGIAPTPRAALYAAGARALGLEVTPGG